MATARNIGHLIKAPNNVLNETQNSYCPVPNSLIIQSYLNVVFSTVIMISQTLTFHTFYFLN